LLGCSFSQLTRSFPLSIVIFARLWQVLNCPPLGRFVAGFPSRNRVRLSFPCTGASFVRSLQCFVRMESGGCLFRRFCLLFTRQMLVFRMYTPLTRVSEFCGDSCSSYGRKELWRKGICDRGWVVSFSSAVICPCDERSVISFFPFTIFNPVFGVPLSVETDYSSHESFPSIFRHDFLPIPFPRSSFRTCSRVVLTLALSPF